MHSTRYHELCPIYLFVFSAVSLSIVKVIFHCYRCCYHSTFRVFCLSFPLLFLPLINSTSFCVFYSPPLRLSLPHRSFISRHHANFFLRFSIYPCQPSRQDQHRHQPDICCGPITARRQRLRHNTEASPRRQAGNTMASKQKFGKTRGVKKRNIQIHLHSWCDFTSLYMHIYPGSCLGVWIYVAYAVCSSVSPSVSLFVYVYVGFHLHFTPFVYPFAYVPSFGLFHINNTPYFSSFLPFTYSTSRTH